MALAALLSAKGIKIRFGGVIAADGIDLDVHEGENLAIIGPNGAGKTTFLNLLSGEMRPSAGSVWFKGRAITGLPPDRVARLGIGRSFQRTNIFPRLSVFDNVQVRHSFQTGPTPLIFLQNQ